MGLDAGMLSIVPREGAWEGALSTPGVRATSVTAHAKQRKAEHYFHLFWGKK